MLEPLYLVEKQHSKRRPKMDTLKFLALVLFSVCVSLSQAATITRFSPLGVTRDVRQIIIDFDHAAEIWIGSRYLATLYRGGSIGPT